MKFFIFFKAIIVFHFLPWVLKPDSYLNRLCYVASFAGNWLVTMVVAGMVAGLPISDFPTKRNSELTKGFYGPGWYALVAATGNV